MSRQQWQAPRLRPIAASELPRLRLRILVKNRCVEFAMLSVLDGGQFGDHLKELYRQQWSGVGGQESVR